MTLLKATISFTQLNFLNCSVILCRATPVFVDFNQWGLGWSNHALECSVNILHFCPFLEGATEGRTKRIRYSFLIEWNWAVHKLNRCVEIENM